MYPDLNDALVVEPQNAAVLAEKAKLDDIISNPKMKTKEKESVLKTSKPVCAGLELYDCILTSQHRVQVRT